MAHDTREKSRQDVCHLQDCGADTNGSFLCQKHWKRLPLKIRQNIWRWYIIDNESKWLEAAMAALIHLGGEKMAYKKKGPLCEYCQVNTVLPTTVGLKRRFCSTCRANTRRGLKRRGLEDSPENTLFILERKIALVKADQSRASRGVKGKAATLKALSELQERLTQPVTSTPPAPLKPEEENELLLSVLNDVLGLGAAATADTAVAAVKTLKENSEGLAAWAKGTKDTWRAARYFRGKVCQALGLTKEVENDRIFAQLNTLSSQEAGPELKKARKDLTRLHEKLSLRGAEMKTLRGEAQKNMEEIDRLRGLVRKKGHSEAISALRRKVEEAEAKADTWQKTAQNHKQLQEKLEAEVARLQAALNGVSGFSPAAIDTYARQTLGKALMDGHGSDAQRALIQLVTALRQYLHFTEEGLKFLKTVGTV